MEKKKRLPGELIRVHNAAGQLHCEDGPALYSENGATCRYMQLGVLHREDGPAIVYKNSPEDNLWFVRGVAVNEKIVMRPQEITPQEIQEEKNLEVRRIMIERVGMENLLTKADAKVIYSGVNEIEGTHESIFEVLGNRYFCGKCATLDDRIYFMEIPNELNGKPLKTGIQARAYLSNLDPKKCIGAT